MRKAIIILNLGVIHLFAAPQGLVIANGEAHFEGNAPNSFTITASDQAILHWSDFSIDQHEKIEFIQPSKDAITVNRVIDANPSRLLGELSANGKIVLINQSGIFVGAQARIDTGSWIASTLDLNTDLFFKNREFRFEGISQTGVINEGSISARSGDLFLVGQNVQNKGVISAQGGKVGAVGACSLGLLGDELFVQFSSSQTPYASTFSVIEGNITSAGGKIFVLGDTVGLSQSALLDVSHDTAPGEIFIGGDFQGKNPNLSNATWTFVENGALIRSDCLLDGNGGRVIVWADSDTVFQGEVSARGCIDGGFAEVSGKRILSFEGKANLQGERGIPGTLLLDPTQITITNAATVGVALGNCGFPGNTYASTVAAGVLDSVGVGSLSAILGLGTSVIVTTSDGACSNAGTGDIIVLGAVSWAANASLTLNAVRDIILTQDIQESNATVSALNRVILNAGRDISISAGSSVGSQNAGTSVNAVRNITMGPTSAQIGFSGNVTCGGSIAVSCNALTMGGSGAIQIGHGTLGAASAIPLITIGANITVNASGNINMTNGPGVNQHCKIGHGSAQMPGGANQDGDITVVCGNNLTMTGVTSGSAATTIGHGPGFSNTILPATITLMGNIDLQITNILTMNGFNGSTAIGHGSLFTQAHSSLIDGDIRVCCGSDATLTGAALISHRTGGNADAFLPTLDQINGDYFISVGGNLSMSNNISGPAVLVIAGCRIGFNNNQRLLLNGIFNLSVCGDLLLSTPFSGSSIGIGYWSGAATSTTSANIAIGGSIIGTNLNTGFRIVSQGDMNLSVGNDIALSLGGGTLDGFISSGRTSGVGLIPATTRIYAGGDLLLSSNGAAVMAVGITPPFQAPTVVPPPPVPPAVSTTTTNIDVRAGGNIQWANTYPTPVPGTIPGSISIQAGHSFAAGEIWNGAPFQLTSVCSQPLAAAFNLGCGNCVQLNMASPAATSICGAFTIQGAGGPVGPVNFTTGAGQPLTLTSLCNSCGGSTSALLVGSTAGNNVQFGGAAGNVGPLILGGMNSIDINQNINSTGSVDIFACHDLDVNPGFTITSNGPITLTADVDNSGMGNLNLLGGDIISNNNQICLLAAPGNFGCNTNNCFSGTADLVLGAVSSVNLLSGQINSGSGPTIINASGNILIDGSAISVLTTTGTISLTAGENVTINEDIISGSGPITTFSGFDTEVNSSLITTSEEIRMIAGDNLSLNGTTSITSTGGFVTLIVDEEFPNSPLIGTGSFTMECLAQINSGASSPVRIFTARQALNSICSSAMINGFLVSDPQFGFPATLFQDTAHEIWCTYFDCPSPYPVFGSGFPFTVFYKDCLQQVTAQAMIVVTQFNVDLHPYNEFPGWEERFNVRYEDGSHEAYLLRRRNLNIINHPKSWTVLLPE